MNRQGTITKIEGQAVWVTFAPLACCGGDGSDCHCASATAEVEFKALNHQDLPLSRGDFVEVSTPTGAALGGIIRLLVIPGVLLALGWVLFGPWAGAVGAAASLGFSILFPQNPESGFPKVERVIPVADFTPFTARV